ncbi:electron transfer flavoprotein subunit alpha [Desulforhabdus amnigena]|uniref:Electron transfer flavoprotein subunit alpha n=1 Tax=Desulforhabdus amnigena TaxID=40218 RepID=A0A9W6FUL5_9BACT|nr:electron transfer flavoprotein subunit alpha [Desulforhabdus amnigena]NLJ27622.1 electron transfer flavoprotein subunit alpha [Deltaproteobacteria bacterium]GLI35147.1 electron transfer flavoprotein subunit alpha [Desulforhabdus amnigena]
MAKNTKGIEVAEILPDKCIACQICIGECPVGAIELSAEGVAHIDPETCIGCGKCFESCPVDAVRFEKTQKKRLTREERGMPSEGVPGYEGVAVFIEVADGAGAQVSWELVGKARELAETLKTKVMGFLLGYGVEAIARDAVAYGCDVVHVVEDPLLEHYLSGVYGKALSDLCEAVRPEIFLIGATHLGRDLAGIVATRLQTGLTADCTGLAIEEKSRLLLMTRPTFGGNIMATIFCERRRPQMSTVRPMVMKMSEKDSARKGEIHRHDWVPPEGELPVIVDFIRDVQEIGSVDIVRSSALVVAGRGACDPATFPLLEELAELVGGTIACSRPVVEAGLMPYERQVGQTGKTVAPKLYIAIGVSGAIQHLVAIQGAEKIVAINSDPKAPIFRVADVGIVGNYLQIVPELIRQLKVRMGQAK